MVKLSILVIAPDRPDLPNVMAEVAALEQHHDVVRLVGAVRDIDIARAVQEGPYDVIWWASHGDYDGVQLSDTVLSIAGVGQYVRATEAELCVLNTCASENIGLAIVAGGRADMICTIADINDPDAMRFGILLAAGLARMAHDQLDFRAVFNEVAPDGGAYRYIPAGSVATRSISQERFNTSLEHIYSIRSDIKIIKASLVALAVVVALLFLLQMLVWSRTNSLMSDLATMQAVYLDRTGNSVQLK